MWFTSAKGRREGVRGIYPGPRRSEGPRDSSRVRQPTGGPVGERSLPGPQTDSQRAYLRLSVFPHDISKKPMQLGSPNLTSKCSTVSTGNLFILGSIGQRSRVTKSRAGVGLCTLVSAGFL